MWSIDCANRCLVAKKNNALTHHPFSQCIWYVESFCPCTHGARSELSLNTGSSWAWEFKPTYIHGPCCRFRGDQNDEDTRTFCGKFLCNAIASTDNAQHKNCPSSRIDDRPGRYLRCWRDRPTHSWSSTRLFRWEGSRQHDRTPTKIASALENFPAAVIMPSAWRHNDCSREILWLGQTEACSNF